MSVIEKWSHIKIDDLPCLSGEELAYFLETVKKMSGMQKRWRLGTVPIERMRELVHHEICHILCNPNAWRIRLGPKNFYQANHAVNLAAGNFLRPLLGGRAAEFRKYLMLLPTLNDLYWVNSVSSRSLEPVFLNPSFWAEKFIMDIKINPPLDDIEPRVRNLLGKENDHRKGPIRMRVFIGDHIPKFWDEVGSKGKRMIQWKNIYWLVYFDNWVSTMLLQFWQKLSKERAITDEAVMEYEATWSDHLPFGMQVQWIDCCQYFEMYVKSNPDLPVFWKEFVDQMRMCKTLDCSFDGPLLNGVGVANHMWKVLVFITSKSKLPLTWT